MQDGVQETTTAFLVKCDAPLHETLVLLANLTFLDTSPCSIRTAQLWLKRTLPTQRSQSRSTQPFPLVLGSVASSSNYRTRSN